MDLHWKEAIRKAKTKRWIDRVKSDLQILEVINDKELANDREAWRDVVIAAKGLNGLTKPKKKNFYGNTV